MAGRFVYTAGGERVWVDDGASTPNSGAYDPSGGGLGAGATPAKGFSQSATGNAGGLPNYYANLEQSRLLWNDAANPHHITAAQAGPVSIDRSSEMATRAQQIAMLNALGGHAAGGGPSVAKGMTLAGKDAAIKAQMAGGGGLRAGLAGGSAMLGQNAMSGAAMKAGEQQNAWQALTNAAYGVRGADIMGSTEEAKLQQQIALANAGFRQQATLANQQASLNALGNRAASAGLYAGLVGENRDAKTQSFGQDLEEERARLANNQKHQDASDSKMANYANTVASMFAMASDERVKTDVKPSDERLSEMFNALSPYEYRYKDTSREGTSPGRHVSVMAQDLEASKLGGSSVFDSEQGHKMVDYGKLAPVMLAELARANKRLNKLEKR